MTDEIAAAAAAEKPLDHLANAEHALDAGGPAGGDPAAAGPEAPPKVTPEQLRAEQAAKDAADADRNARGGNARDPAKLPLSIDADGILDKRSFAGQGALNEAGPVSQARSAIADPPREIPAAERLRAFEDEHLGEKAVRIGGRIERGYGSPFAAMSDEKKRQYGALEKLVAAEQKLADAHAALIQAEADHEAALAAAEPKPDAAE